MEKGAGVQFQNEADFSTHTFFNEISHSSVVPPQVFAWSQLLCLFFCQSVFIQESLRNGLARQLETLEQKYDFCLAVDFLEAAGGPL